MFGAAKGGVQTLGVPPTGGAGGAKVFNLAELEKKQVRQREAVRP